MNAKRYGLVLVMGAALSLSAVAETAQSGGSDASIPFANHGGIRNWRADGQKGLWVQGSGNQWYYAKFMGSCSGLPFAETLAFVSEPNGELNRWSSVRVRHGERCQFADFQRSDGPPVKAKKAAPAVDKAVVDKPVATQPG